MSVRTIKFPRIYHLPTSPGISSDDKVATNSMLDELSREVVVVTEKLDGENTAFFLNDGQISTHARSPNPRPHPSRNYLKRFLSERYVEIASQPAYYKFFGEYLYAKHSIEYVDLEDYLYLFAILDASTNYWLAWGKVVAVAKQLRLPVPKVIYTGKFDTFAIAETFEKYKNSVSHEIEGYVIRPERSFAYNKDVYLAVKWVRKGHVTTNEHWTTNWYPNKLRGSEDDG